MTHFEPRRRPGALIVAVIVPMMVSAVVIRAAGAQTSDSVPLAPDPAPQAANADPQRIKFTPGTDLSLGIFGEFTASRVATSTANYSYGTELSQLTQTATPSGGAL